MGPKARAYSEQRGNSEARPRHTVPGHGRGDAAAAAKKKPPSSPAARPARTSVGAAALVRSGDQWGPGWPGPH
jgi:hypothetical protein